MYWSDREEEARGSSVIVPIFMIRADDYITHDDQEAHDRVVLLAKKYASENVNLNKENVSVIIFRNYITNLILKSLPLLLF